MIGLVKKIKGRIRRKEQLKKKFLENNIKVNKKKILIR